MLDFLKKSEEINESYWSILIENQWVASAIWQVKNEKVEIIASSPGTRWEGDLTEAVDSTLSSCTQNLAEDFEDPNKTVFGLSSSWIEDGNIKNEYLSKLKKICEDLSLTPSGFVVLSEAISHFIKTKEQTLFSGITLGVSDQSLELSVFNLGKLLGTTIVARSVSVSDDLIEGLSRLIGDFENFPARIVLYNQKEAELEEIKNSLNEINWERIETLKFLHVPKIEILNPDEKILAVSLAGGSEIAKVENVSYEEGLSHQDAPYKNIEPNNYPRQSSYVEQTEVEDIPEDEIKNIEQPVGVTAEDLGFVVESQVKGKVNLPSIANFAKAPKIKFNFPKFPKINISFSGRPFIFAGLSFFVILTLLFLAWWFLPKAAVTIFVAPKKLEDKLTLNLNDLPNDLIETSVSGEKSRSTTGTKTVGDKAKGQVKIQNGTAFPINLAAGTILLSSSDLKFVTTKSASISGALSPSEPGIAVVDIEAGNIGSEYNLAKDEKFKVGNYPKAEVDATSISNLVGGSSRQISAVAESDRTILKTELLEELTNQAKIKLNEQISSEKIIVDSTITSETEDENFSNKIGDEASTVRLSLSLKFTASSISKSELGNVAKKTLEKRIPTGFVLRDDQIIYDFVENDKPNTVDVKIIANLLPSVNTEEISKKISGKYPKVAEEYLQSIPGFTNAQFRLPSILRGRLATLPHLSKNIDVVISSEE